MVSLIVDFRFVQMIQLLLFYHHTGPGKMFTAFLKKAVWDSIKTQRVQVVAYLIMVRFLSNLRGHNVAWHMNTRNARMSSNSGKIIAGAVLVID